MDNQKLEKIVVVFTKKESLLMGSLAFIGGVTVAALASYGIYKADTKLATWIFSKAIDPAKE